MEDHGKLLEKLRQKTDEVEKLFAEGRQLEQENLHLRDEVATARRMRIDAENRFLVKEAECRTLESTLGAQQTTIQELLNAEMQRATGKPVAHNQLALPAPRPGTGRDILKGVMATSSSARAAAALDAAANQSINNAAGEGSGINIPSLPPAAILQMEKERDELMQQVESLQQQLQAASRAHDEAKKGAAIHADEMARIQQRMRGVEADANSRVEAAERRVQEATDRAKSLQEALQLMREQHKARMAEAAHLEGVDAQAREGMRSEWMTLASENERLMRVADDAAAVQARVRQEHERVLGQLVSQRAHFDTSAGVLRRELEAVHEENDRMLVNLQRVAAERDALRRDLEKAESLTRQQLDVDSSVVAARELRRQIAEATASQQADASRAAGLERDLMRVRDELAATKAELGKARTELADAQGKVLGAKREAELAKRGGASEVETLGAALEQAQRQLRELQSATDVAQMDPARMGAFVDEIETTTAELCAVARETASFLAGDLPLQFGGSGGNLYSDAGSPRQTTIRQRMGELRGIMRWMHSTLGEITHRSTERSSRVAPAAAAATAAPPPNRLPSVPSNTGTGPTSFTLAASSSSDPRGGGLMRGSSVDGGDTGLRALSVQRRPLY